MILERQYIQKPSRSFNCRHRNTPEKVFIGFYRYVFLVQIPPQEVFGCIGQCLTWKQTTNSTDKKNNTNSTLPKNTKKHPCPSISTCKQKNDKLVVSTHLKNISQIGPFPSRGENKKYLKPPPRQIQPTKTCNLASSLPNLKPVGTLDAHHFLSSVEIHHLNLGRVVQRVASRIVFQNPFLMGNCD